MAVRGTLQGYKKSVEYPPTANVPGVDKRLVDIVRRAADQSPYTVRVTPYGGAVRGKRSATSQHVPSKGRALDIQLYDAQGRAIPNYQHAGSFRVYEEFAQTARAIQKREYPELNNKFRWGGYFSGKPPKYGAMDLMHFDLGGANMGAGSWEHGLNNKWARVWGVGDSVGMGAIGASASRTPPAPVSPLGSKTLKQGSRGPNVTALQQTLQRAGFNVDINGQYDAQTARAVQAYQHSLNQNPGRVHALGRMKEDGIVGPQTRAPLTGLIERQSRVPIPRPRPVPTVGPTAFDPASPEIGDVAARLGIAERRAPDVTNLRPTFDDTRLTPDVGPLAKIHKPPYPAPPGVLPPPHPDHRNLLDAAEAWRKQDTPRVQNALSKLAANRGTYHPYADTPRLTPGDQPIASNALQNAIGNEMAGAWRDWRGEPRRTIANAPRPVPRPQPPRRVVSDAPIPRPRPSPSAINDSVRRIAANAPIPRPRPTVSAPIPRMRPDDGPRRVVASAPIPRARPSTSAPLPRSSPVAPARPGTGALAAIEASYPRSGQRLNYAPPETISQKDFNERFAPPTSTSFAGPASFRAAQDIGTANQMPALAPPVTVAEAPVYSVVAGSGASVMPPGNTIQTLPPPPAVPEVPPFIEQVLPPVAPPVSVPRPRPRPVYKPTNPWQADIDRMASQLSDVTVSRNRAPSGLTSNMVRGTNRFGNQVASYTDSKGRQHNTVTIAGKDFYSRGSNSGGTRGTSGQQAAKALASRPGGSSGGSVNRSQTSREKINSMKPGSSKGPRGYRK